MRRRKIVALLICWCLLLSLLPLYAVHATSAEGQEVHQKEYKLETLFLPEQEEKEIELQNVWADRIRYIFPDPALAEVIARAFGVGVHNFVTQADLDRVVALAADSSGIQNLQGIQRLTALRQVSLNENQIQNLQPLASLHNLERLLLDDNRVQNLAPLAGLTNLEWLWLDHNQVRELEPLSALTRMTWLTLWGNQVEDLRPLSRMTDLNALWLADNRIEDLAPLQGLISIEAISLANNRITDLRPLEGMRQMTLLWLGRQEILLTQAMRTNPFEKQSAVRTPSGDRVRPTEFSHGGEYVPPMLRWEALTDVVGAVQYRFRERIALGRTVDWFYGTVTQPLAATPFVDVRRNDWFYDAVAFVFEGEIMSGVNPNRFAPEENLTRAMAVMILHRVAGAPEEKFRPVFSDVPEGIWFAEAALWAYAHGIIQGQGSTEAFAPDQSVSREQMATMFFRFAEGHGRESVLPKDFTIENFPDHQTVSSWAEESMIWAVYQGIFTGGQPPQLAPRAGTTRGEAASMFMRFV